MVENGITGDVIGAAFDGTGYGTDGNVWGGEFLAGRAGRFARAGHFDYIHMPGAEAAIREPGRMAASYIYKATGKCADGRLKAMIDKGFNSPLTSSVGRLFDAAGSIILGKPKITTEAEIPIELENMSDAGCLESYAFSMSNSEGRLLVSADKMIRGILRDMNKGVEKGKVAAKFHNTIAEIITATALSIRKKYRIKKVALSGGVFVNAFLRRRALDRLEKFGFSVYSQAIAATGDNGIPVGQVAIANARIKCV
jgi:hydrogenase maturation protein HypF